MTRFALASAALLLIGTASPVSADEQQPVASRVLFSFADEDVYESSGLVDRGEVVFTTNDSGDDAVLYGVDPDSGKTVSRTTYADAVEDVEALAPGPDGTVWAADIGDNRERRETVTVHRVTPGRDAVAPAYDLTYPDGPRDAETLLVHPRTGRILVVSKSVFGGTVYAAPARLRTDAPTRLRTFAQVPGLVTDGAFFPDGQHVVLRTYGTASVYTFPAFERVGTVPLPPQKQGEAVSVAADGRVLVSSEGVAAEVLEVDLPADLTRATPAPGATPSGPAPETRTPPARPAAATPSRTGWQWAGVAGVAVGVGVLGWLAVRMSRVRGPR